MKAGQKLSMQESSSNKGKLQEFTKSEIYSRITVPDNIPFIVRLDGWKFRALSEKLETEKPFDERIAKCLAASGRQIVNNFNPAVAYIISDEINLLFIKNYPFDGRIEKINSILSGLTSSTFSLNLENFFKRTVNVSFDSRIVVLPEKDIVKYFAWRQQNGWRNHNNAYAYWLLRKLGYSPKKASEKLKGIKAKEIHELLHTHGINLSKTPTWQRRGILIYKKTYERKGAKRRKIVENWDPPLFTEPNGEKLLRQTIEKAMKKNE